MTNRWKITCGVLVAVLASMFISGSASADTVTKTWAPKYFTLDSGRIYWADVPSCAPATDQACIDFMSTPRPVLFYLHPKGAVEDPFNVAAALKNLHVMQANSIFVYPISKDYTLAWDSGVCCTAGPVDDLGYLADTVQQLSGKYAVNPNRVGLFGVSNGGMLAEKAVCDRPDVFKAGASWAGTYSGDCSVAKVKLAQWHGANDTTVPLDGGSTVIDGVNYTFPPADSLAKRMVAGAIFTLAVLTGYDHTPPTTIYQTQVNWLTSQFVG